MPSDVPLTRESFGDLHPIVRPEPLRPLSDRIWTADEWERIRRGSQARDMDEKWHVFAEGDVVFLHRSWTGRGIYEVSFSPVAGGGRKMTSAVVETDPESYRRTSDDFDRLMLELIISTVVLGEPADDLRAALSNLRPGTTDLHRQAMQHSVLGARGEPRTGAN